MTVASYRLLEQTAAMQHGQYDQLAGKIHNLRYRSSTALKRVQQGLAIDKAACVGIGASSADNRFKPLPVCGDLWELEIPSAVVTWDGDLITGGGRERAAHAGPVRRATSTFASPGARRSRPVRSSRSRLEECRGRDIRSVVAYERRTRPRLLLSGHEAASDKGRHHEAHRHHPRNRSRDGRRPVSRSRREHHDAGSSHRTRFRSSSHSRRARRVSRSPG